MNADLKNGLIGAAAALVLGWLFLTSTGRLDMRPKPCECKCRACQHCLYRTGDAGDLPPAVEKQAK